MEAAVQRALARAGHETRLFDDRRTKRRFGRALTQRLALRAARRFRPDFVVLSKCLALDLDTVHAIVRGVPNSMWYHDPQWHRDLDRPDIAHIAAVGRMAATFFVTGFVDEWRAHGLNARFLPPAGDRGIEPVPPRAAYASSLSFIGTGYDEERARFLLAVNEQLPVRVFGPGWEEWRRELRWNGGPVEGADFAAVCSSAKITLGVNPARAAGATTYASDRVWMVILGGAFYLGAGTPGIDRFLLDGVHCAWYRGLDHCIESARSYLAHDTERERIRAEGERFVRAHHTYDQRVANLLSGEEWVNPLD
jgi:hypothetical protein